MASRKLFMIPQMAVGLVASTAVSVLVLEHIHHRGHSGTEFNVPERDDKLKHIYSYVRYAGLFLSAPGVLNRTDCFVYNCSDCPR